MTQLDAIPFEVISEKDLNALIESAVEEAKTLDYKLALPGKDLAAKKEFLADVSSFANASGGHIIYGIREREGAAAEIAGLDGIDPDQEILRLESIIRDGIDPRIPGIQSKTIQTADSKVAIIIRVPRSWALPHVVKETNRFYSRTSRGKYLLDVRELRSLFLLSETASERVRRFRSERLGTIMSGEVPVLLEPHAMTVLHIVPLASLNAPPPLDLRSAFSLSENLLNPLGALRHRTRFNFDGLLTFDLNRETGKAWSYLQLFRTGMLETVDAGTLDALGNKQIPSKSFDQKLMSALPIFFDLLTKAGMSPPFVIALTLVGVKDYMMAVEGGRDSGHAIDRDVLLVPEVMLETPQFDPIICKQLLDAIWNAAGFGGTPNLDGAGAWIGQS